MSNKSGQPLCRNISSGRLRLMLVTENVVTECEPFLEESDIFFIYSKYSEELWFPYRVVSTVFRGWFAIINVCHLPR